MVRRTGRVALLSALIICSLHNRTYAQEEACTVETQEALCAGAPFELRDHCGVLASYLIDWQDTVCSLEPSAGYYPQYAASLSRASGNIGTLLLSFWTMDSVETELVRLTEMGVSVVELELTYPLLTPAFHDHLATLDSSYSAGVDDYLSFYREVVSRSRARGLKVFVKHATMLAGMAATDPRSYFAQVKSQGASLARERYRQENANEIRLIVTELAPDYLSLLTEPETQNAAFGPVQNEVLFQPAEWGQFVDYAIDLLPAGHTTELGAGSGTWDRDDYIEMFSAIPELDFIDLHVYPARSDFMDFFARVIDWKELVQSHDPEKKIVLGEAWIYKLTASELTGANFVEVFARDPYSYWAPLDTKFIELFSRASRALEFEIFTPFWTNYLFAYSDHSEASLLTPQERLTAARLLSSENMQQGILTPTGQRYKELALETNILVVGAVEPDHGPEIGPGADQMVMINGENFDVDGVTSVLFGDSTSTEVEVLDNRTLRARVPSGSGSTEVTVVSPDGRTRTRPEAYLYDPPPVALSVSPESASEAGGGTAVITAENLQAGSTDTQVHFGPLEASEVVVYEGFLTVRIPNGTGLGTVDVSIRNPDLQEAILSDGFFFVPPPTISSISPATGPSTGGTEVTISGQNFVPGSTSTQVWFGSQQASSVSVTSESEILVTIPSGFETVPVQVVNPDYQTVVLPNAFTYQWTPVILYVGPMSGPRAGGNSVWIVGYGFEPGAVVTFGGTQTDVEAFTPNVLRVVAPPGSGQVELKVTNLNGLEGSWSDAYTYLPFP